MSTSSDTPQPQSTTPMKPKPPLHHHPNPLTTQTPDKPQPPPLPRRNHHQTDHIKSARRQILSNLPQNYEILGEFFDCLDSSIRLLRLKGSTSTFTNISPKIQCLSHRRFRYKELAQLKYILPEAIEIKKVLVFDERTSCMKHDLHVSLNVDSIDCEGKLESESKNLHLSKVFRDRLVEFHNAHPQGDEVPEEMLPEPFNHSHKDLHSNIITTASAVETSTEALENGQPTVVASHLPQSFRRHFSRKVTDNETEKTDEKSSKVSLQPSVLPVPEPCLSKVSSNVEPGSSAAPSPTKLLSKPTSGGNCLAYCASPSRLPTFPPATPIKELDIMKSRDGSPTKIDTIQSTPAKLASTPARLMSATPALRPPKICYMIPDEDSTSSPNKLVRRPPRNRSLKFEDEVSEIEGVSVDDDDDDDDDILPEDLLQPIREKETNAIEERDPAISQEKRRQQMIAFLPKLFNLIHFFFQSIKRSIITKEELIHKIIASNCDIVDRREVEEQLNLLLELVPEWISEKLASGDDLLVCINKMSSAESICARLAEAK